MIEKLRRFISSSSTVLAAYLLAGLVAAIQHYWRGSFDNYKIFARSLEHLRAGSDLYAAYPDQHFGVFLYHPTFPILFAPFSSLPDLLGLVAWTLFSSWIFYYSIGHLPLSNTAKVFVWWYSFVPTVTSLQNSQTNPVLVALVLLSLAAIVEKSALRFGVFSVLGFFIKGYGIIAVALISQQTRLFWRGVLVATGFFVLLSLLPVFVVGLERLPGLYSDWWTSLHRDAMSATGTSLIGFLRAWTGTTVPTWVIQGVGVAMLLSVVAFTMLSRCRTLAIKVLVSAYLLMWVVLFNHKAEMNTHLLSLVGVALWYVVVPKTRANRVLTTLAFVVTGLTPTDFCPKWIRDGYLKPYVVVVVPIILIWLKSHYDFYREVRVRH